jgi:hypothetical protein
MSFKKQFAGCDDDPFTEHLLFQELKSSTPDDFIDSLKLAKLFIIV